MVCGQSEFLTGQLGEACRLYNAALRSAPTFAEAHLAIAVALTAHGAHAQAEQHLQEAIRQAPQHYEAHFRLGQLLHARGAADRAIQHWRKAIESPEARIRAAAAEKLRNRQMSAK